MSPTIAVVGGGIAGLAAAHRLAHAGADVVLFERDRLGGKIRTSEFAGRPVDEAADAFLIRVPWALELATHVGLGDRLVAPAARNAYVVVEGQLRPFPDAQLLGVPTDLDALASSGVLTAAGVDAARHDLDHPAPPPDGDVAIGPYLRRRLGDEVVDRLVGPLVGGINAGDIDQLSLAAVTPQIDAAVRDPDERSLIRAAAAMRARAAAGGAGGGAADRGTGEPATHEGGNPAADATAARGRAVGRPNAGAATGTTGEPATHAGGSSGSGQPSPVFNAPARGMGQLVDALANELASLGVAVRLGTEVVAIEPGPGAGGWALALSTGPSIDVDGVVVAARAAGGLLGDLAPEGSEFLSEVEHASVALVTLAFQPGDLGPLDGSGFLVPRSEGWLVTACSWSSSKWAHLAPEAGDGTVIVRASVGRAGDRRFDNLDDGELVERVVDDLRRVTEGLGQPAAQRVSRWPRSFPQYAPGHLDRVDALEAELTERHPSVTVAGAALRGVGVPACIHSGQQAADAVLRAT
jgi:oxygen-dependent protoporphyrinogen oxidase